MKKKLLALTLLLISINLQAQDDPQKLIDEFFKLYTNKGSDTALDFLFRTNKWMSESKEDIQNVKVKLKGTINQLGGYYGHDLITKKTIGDDMALYCYFIRYDRQPLRFTLQFYNPNGTWRLQNFSYDDTFDEELKEASKSYRLKENLEY